MRRWKVHKIIVRIGDAGDVLREALGSQRAHVVQQAIKHLMIGPTSHSAAKPVVFDVDGVTATLSAFVDAYGHVPTAAEWPIEKAQQWSGIWGSALAGKTVIVFRSEHDDSEEAGDACIFSSTKALAEIGGLIDALVPIVRDLPAGLPDEERERAVLRAYSVARAIGDAVQKIGRNQVLAIVGA